MTGKSNVAGTKLFAAIGVTYPAGSTATCSKGTKTLTAKNTSGQWVFAIPEAGTWTVTAGNKSQSVIISDEGQFESVNLASLYLVKNGEPLIGFTELSPVGGRVTIGDTITFSSGEQAIRSTDKIDCTKYTKLIAAVNVTSREHDYPFNVVVSDNSTSYEAYIQLNPANAPSPVLAYAQKKPVDNNVLNVVELDISTITGSHYVGIGLAYIPGSTVENFYLE